MRQPSHKRPGWTAQAPLGWAHLHSSPNPLYNRPQSVNTGQQSILGLATAHGVQADSRSARFSIVQFLVSSACAIHTGSGTEPVVVNLPKNRKWSCNGDLRRPTNSLNRQGGIRSAAPGIRTDQRGAAGVPTSAVWFQSTCTDRLNTACRQTSLGPELLTYLLPERCHNSIPL